MMIETGWIDRDFIERHTVGFDAVAAYCARGRRRGSPRSPACRALDPQGGGAVGTAKSSFLFHARGIEHHSNGVQNALGTINLVLASGRIGKPKERLRHDRRVRRTGRADASTGRSATSCRAGATSPIRSTGTSPAVWGVDEADLPGPGVDAYELFRKIDAGEIRAPLDLLQPEGLAARQCSS